MMRGCIVLIILIAHFISAAHRCRGQTVSQLLVEQSRIQLGQRRYAAAEELLEDALEVAESSQTEGICKAQLAIVKFGQQQREVASRLARQALRYDLPGADAAQAEIILAKSASSTQQSRIHFSNALAHLAGSGQSELTAETQLALSSLQLADSQFTAAFESSQRAIRQIGRDRNPDAYMQALAISAFASANGGHANRLTGVWQTLERLLEAREGKPLPCRDAYHARYAEAELLYRRGDYLAALETFGVARRWVERCTAENDAALVPVILRQSELLTAMGKIDDATRLIEWVRYHEDRLTAKVSSEVHAVRGKIAMAGGDYRAAARHFANALAVIRSHPEDQRQGLKTRLVEARLMGGLADSDQTFRRLLESVEQMQLASNWRLLAQSKLLAGRYTTAHSIASHAYQLLGNDSGSDLERLRTLLIRADARIQTGDLAAAEHDIAEMREVCARLQGISDIWPARIISLAARIHLARGEDRIAFSELEHALRIWQKLVPQGESPKPRPEFWSPEKADVHLGMLIICLAARDQEAAQEHWEAAYLVMDKQLSHERLARRIASTADFCQSVDRIVECVWLFEHAKQAFYRAGLSSDAAEIDRELNRLHARHPAPPVEASTGG